MSYLFSQAGSCRPDSRREKIKLVTKAVNQEKFKGVRLINNILNGDDARISMVRRSKGDCC